MMKKIYTSPKIQVFNIKLIHTISVSSSRLQFSSDGSSGYQLLSDETAGSDVFARGSSADLWED